MMIYEDSIIDDIRLYEVKIPLKVPFRISGGVSYARKSLIVVLSGDGFSGYGESAPFEEPYYSSETISSVKALYKELLFPRILHKKINSIRHLNQIIGEGVRGNYFAKAGIENAYWDLICKKNGITLKEAILHELSQFDLPEQALQSKNYITSGVSVGIPAGNEIKQLTDWAQEYKDEGYRRIKIKIKPGWDLKPLDAVRKKIGDFPLWVDANASYSYEEHRDIFKQMDQYKCLFYEQPLCEDDIIDHAKLARYVKTPICLDESLKSASVARKAVEMEASRIWNIKIQRIGGLWQGLLIYKLAVENHISLWGGTMPESGLGAVPILNLASFSAFQYPADVEASKRWYGEGSDLYEIKMNAEGKIFIPECKGMEEIINFDNLHKYGDRIKI